MRREEIIGVLRAVPNGIPITQLLAQLRVDANSAEGCAIEALLWMISEARLIEGRWHLVEEGKPERVLAAIESYAATTGRRLFRAAAALECLPLQDQPTIEELAELIKSSSGKYSLLTNAMIKRNS